MSSPVEASQRPGLPGPAVTIQRPSGLKRASLTIPKWARNFLTAAPLRAFHTIGT